MRLPWVQVDQSAFARSEELAAILEISAAQALGHLVMLWRWAIELGPEDEPPTGEVEGRVAAIRLEAGAGWAGERGSLFAALVDLGLVDGSAEAFRVRGLGRYGAVVSKRAADRARKAEAKQQRPAGSRAEVARKSHGIPEESQGKTQTQTHRTTPPVSPPRGDAPPKRESLPSGPSNDELFGPGNSLRDALEQRWQEATGAPYAWDERRDGHATRRILHLAGDDAREVLRRWDVALATRYPRPTSVADLAKYWNAYAAAEPPPPGPKRAADVPAAAPAPSGACSVCPDPAGADVWGQRLCNAHGVELMDAMGTSPSAAAASRWVGDRKRGAA